MWFYIFHSRLLLINLLYKKLSVRPCCKSFSSVLSSRLSAEPALGFRTAQASYRSMSYHLHHSKAFRAKTLLNLNLILAGFVSPFELPPQGYVELAYEEQTQYSNNQFCHVVCLQLEEGIDVALVVFLEERDKLTRF